MILMLNIQIQTKMKVMRFLKLTANEQGFAFVWEFEKLMFTI
jgi:hypothetical protein